MRNRLGITDPDRLAEAERAAAAIRVAELEKNPIEGRFDFPHLQAIHRCILHDVYDWAGDLRTDDTTAFGIPHARPQFLPDELDRVFRQIAANPPSATDKGAATDTIAAHWSELTLVHPVLDGNSRSQRVFFDQMFRHAGWGVDWTNVDAAAAHAARHMSVYNRPDYLADQLRHAVHPAADLPAHTLASTQGHRDSLTATEHFRAMITHHRSGSTEPYPVHTDQSRSARRRTIGDLITDSNPAARTLAARPGPDPSTASLAPNSRLYATYQLPSPHQEPTHGPEV